MKNDLIKKILPHFIAVIIFLGISVFFCKPVLEGNVLNQHDILGWKGVAQNAFDYKEKTGHFPLWNTNVFSGMPNYMIAMEGKTILPNFNAIFGLGLPQPVNFFFIACICFYILCLSLRIKPVIAIFGALAYAFATYNPVIINAGHVTKMFAIAYMPLLLAGLMLTYEKKYWLGLAVTTLGTYMEIGANHPQINYYFILIAAAVTISYLVSWIRNKERKHIAIAAAITAVSVIAGFATTSLSFFTTKEYAKATIRGGGTLAVEGDSVKSIKREGLDTSYAFQYSMKKSEPLVSLMPGAFGGSSANPLDENSHVVKSLTDKGVPENSAVQVAGSLPKYWGGLESTTGPPYLGAIICIVAILGFVLLKHPLRWGLLVISFFAVLMSWGKFFPGFNVFLFENLPLYNKFRAPSMALVILQLTIPLTAVLTLQQILVNPDSAQYLKLNFKKVLYTLGGLLALLVLLYIGMDYSSSIDRQVLNNKWDQSGTDTIGRTIVSALKSDRSSMFGGQLLRTIAYMALVLALLWLYLKNRIKPIIVIITLGVIAVIDLLVIDSKYLNEENYQSKDESQQTNFTKTAIDEQILNDKEPHFRVYNSGQDRFSASDFHVSNFHQAIGGYHPAKLRIYQDIIERYLSGGDNQQVLNMLNTKYIIVQNPQNGQQMLFPNNEKYGPCWLVKNVRIVKDDVDEIQAIGKTDLKDTAIVQQSFASNVTQPQWDSVSIIKMTKFDNDEIEYSADCQGTQFAVFSEIYYPYGWNAYLDGKKTNYVKTNYILRGMSLPAGKHIIKFVFEPSSYKKGITISYIGSFAVALFVLGGLFMAWRENRNKQKAA